MPIRAILVPTDFSPAAGAAWNYAQMLAEQFNSRLHLVHVLTPPPFVSDPTGAERLTFQVADLLRESAKAVRRALDRTPVKRELARRVVRATVTGKPLDEILKYVDARAIDLVVMGTHGRGAVQHAFLGSVAERVVRHCPVPVITIHGAARRRGGRRPATRSRRRK